MAPVLVTPKIIFHQAQGEAAQKCLKWLSAIDFRSEDGDRSGTGFQEFRVKIEGVKNWRRGDNRKSDKNQDFFPIIFQEIFACQEKAHEHHNEDGRRDAKSDVGMKTDAKNQTAQSEIPPFFGAKTAEEKIESKNQNQREHVGPKRDAGKIDCPIGNGDQIASDESDALLSARGKIISEEFFSEEIGAEDGQCSAKNSGKDERHHADAEKLEADGNKIHEKPLSAIIGGVEHLVVARVDGVDCVNAVDGFIRIDSWRSMLDVDKTQEKSQRDDRKKQNINPNLLFVHYFLFWL